MSRLSSYLERSYRYRIRQVLDDGNVSIISNDCWGSQPYNYASLSYATPFVGLFIMAPCYLSLLSDLETQLKKSTFQFVTRSKYGSSNNWRLANGLGYPIGILNERFEIHFLHYKNAIDAETAWLRRCERINFGNLAVKFDGSKDEASAASMIEFDSLPFKKKVLINNSSNYSGLSYELNCTNWIMDGAKMFRISHQEFDFLDWVESGIVHRTVFSRVIDRFCVSKSDHLL